MEPPYKVGIIPSDLRQEEFVHRVCDSLEYLNSIAKDVFDRISNRITENQQQLQSINNRIAVAQAKVNALKGSNKATKVFSSAKYPTTEEEPYNTIYSGPGLPLDPKKTHYRLQSKHRQIDERTLKEKLQFYNVQVGAGKQRDSFGATGEGLGRLPKNISSVSSLLLFNTSENPYKKYVMLDPLGVVMKTRRAVEEEEGLAEAPSTILQREELHRQIGENYTYMPGMGEVPEIAVPDFLPDLLGVADDLSYMADAGRSIAPSAPTNLPDLPEFGAPEETLPAGPMSAGEPSNQPPPSAPPPSAPPPPPPPPPPAAAPPPPPPPPPPPGPPPAPADQPPAPDAETPKHVQGAPEGVVSPDAGRASLLESIRQAGGAGKAKLRDAKSRKVEAKKKKQEEKESSTAASSGGGDLMADLSKRLLMRRKGISGTVKAGGGDPAEPGKGGDSNAMSRISAMIPPPPQTEASQEDDGRDWG